MKTSVVMTAVISRRYTATPLDLTRVRFVRYRSDLHVVQSLHTGQLETPGNKPPYCIPIGNKVEHL